MKYLAALTALAATCLASAIPSDQGLVFPKATEFGKRACQNTPTSRNCWGNYDINTNYYNVVPNTGVTREYWLTLTNTTLSPDGVPRQVLTVNGTIPGPLIWANWGDNLIIHVQNNLQNNGTSIHWHGIQQNRTNQNDGVNSLTQCPTAPGQSYTYKWRATQYGSSWYHSHYSLQAWEGVQGPIIIYGPATANYDVDMGSILLNDWSHQTVDALYQYAQTKGPVTLDNGLINGTNTWQNVGKRFSTSVQPGKKYLYRLVNGAIDTHFKFSIDNHTMTVIAMDFVPIKPFNTTFVTIGMGERYDVIVTANQPSNQDYWIRAVPQTACSENTSRDNIKGALRYTTGTADPTTTGYNLPDDCLDFPMASLVPQVAMNVGSSSTQNLSVGLSQNQQGFFKWSIGGPSMFVNYSDPTLLELANNPQKTNWPPASNVITLSQPNTWHYFVISTGNTAPQVPHPIHLHGHDFSVLAQGQGNFTSSTPLQTNNPPRRDVAMLPANGYLVLGYMTDNPGVWLMHCHIGWHVAEGFDLQFIERQTEITIDQTTLQQQCSGWNAYAKQTMFVEGDSGV